MSRVKIDWDDEKTASWMGTAAVAGNMVVRGANFTLQQMLQRTASRLDVANSAIRIEFRRVESSEYRWVAVATFRDDSRSNEKYDVRAEGPDPMHALAALVEGVEG